MLESQVMVPELLTLNHYNLKSINYSLLVKDCDVSEFSKSKLFKEQDAKLNKT